MSRILTLHHPSHARRYYAEGQWHHDTLYSLLLSHAQARASVVAVRDGRHQLTWSELQRWTDAIAARLSAQGLAPGDRIALWMSNRIEAIATFLACSREGFICNPSLHRTHTCSEVVQLLQSLGAKVLIAEEGWGAGRSAGQLEEMLRTTPLPVALYSPETLITSVGPAAPANRDPDKVVYAAFTSGTTGTPKCVMHSDNTLLANARDLVRDWALQPDAVLLTLSPLSHHIAWVAVAQWLLSGCQLVTDDPPAGTSRLRWIVANRATYVMGVPTHAIDLLRELNDQRVSRLGEVEVFYMAGAPIPPSVAEAFVKLGIKPQNVYGMTENSSHQYTHPTDDTAAIIASCGRGGGAYEVKLFDVADPDRPAAPGAVGQIGGRGAALMLGYFGNQGATEASFNRDGWFLSGDLGSFDANGNLRIEGRIKDLIIRGGHNIYPAHIEAFAMRHPEVVKAACFGVPDERLGERVCLSIIGSAEPAALQRHLTACGLSKYELPEYFLRVEQFPLTPSGKILKRILNEEVRRGTLIPQPMHSLVKEQP